MSLERFEDLFGQLNVNFKIQGMRHRIQIFLPDKTAAGTPILTSIRKRVSGEIKSLLSAVAGGCTTQEATGSWVGPVGRTVDESVDVIESYSHQPFPPELLKTIVNLVLFDLEQTTATMVIDQDMYHFTRE